MVFQILEHPIHGGVRDPLFARLGQRGEGFHHGEGGAVLPVHGIRGKHGVHPRGKARRHLPGDHLREPITAVEGEQLVQHRVQKDPPRGHPSRPRIHVVHDRLARVRRRDKESAAACVRLRPIVQPDRVFPLRRLHNGQIRQRFPVAISLCVIVRKAVAEQMADLYGLDFHGSPRFSFAFWSIVHLFCTNVNRQNALHTL